jgi:hypothetical protein
MKTARFAYCGLRDAVAEPAPATSTEVPLPECWASSAPAPFAATAPLLVVALMPPPPERLAAGDGFGLVAAAVGAVLELTLGLGVVALVGA